MKHKPHLISIPSTSAFRLDRTTFLRMMRDMRKKIGMADNVSLIGWAKRQMKGID